MTELIPEPHNNHAETGAPEEAPQPVEASEQRAAAERAALAPEAVNARRDTSGAIPREQPPDPEAGAASNEATGPRSADWPVKSTAAGPEPRSDAADSPTGAVPNSGAQTPATGVPAPESGAGKDSAPDDESATDDGDAQRGRISLHDVHAGRDVNAAGRDLHITNYLNGLARLLPHRIDPDAVLTPDLFVGAVPRPPAETGVVVLAGERDSGRRTAALRLLAERVGAAQIHELYPDWEKPDVDRIPCDPKTGYLIDLSGERGIGADFYRRLSAYGAQAAARRTLLVVLVGTDALHASPSPTRSLAVRTHQRPDAREVARRLIDAGADPEEDDKRVEWLDDASVFAGKLPADAPPARGAELAAAVLDAGGPYDEAGLDRFQQWGTTLDTWFTEEEESETEARALRISTAFLEGAPARTVLDSADTLLESEEVNWSWPRGGLLAAGDDSARCRGAGLLFADGTVWITNGRPGIDRALVRRLWAQRPRAVGMIRNWLAAISAPDGPARGELARLADALTDLAAEQGPGDVLDLAQQWLANGRKDHVELAGSVVDRLSVDVRFGARVREDLTNWAKGSGSPQRQKAVARAVCGEFGRAYPRVALTRLRYVFESGRDADVQKAAREALLHLVVGEYAPLAALQAAVEWAEKSAGHTASGTAFLALFVEPVPEGARGPADLLLGLEGEDGAVARALLVRGVLASWDCADGRVSGPDLLAAWRGQAEAGNLPTEAVIDVASEVCGRKGFRDEGVGTVVHGGGEIRQRIANRLMQTLMGESAAVSDAGGAAEAED